MGTCSSIRRRDSSPIVNKRYNARLLAEEWGVTPDLVSPTDDIVMAFCHAKGLSETMFANMYYQARSEAERKQTNDMPHVVRNFRHWWLTSDHVMAQQAQQTLDELLNEPNSSFNIPRQISFDAFVERNPKWAKQPGVFVFPRDHSSVAQRSNSMWIQRTQLSGNCYVHGPIVVLHYAMAMHVDESETIDARGYILKCLPPELLIKMICHVGGGSSREIFNHLLHQCRSTKTRTNPLIVASDLNHMEENMRLHGPALVSGFHIEAAFRNAQDCHYGHFNSSSNLGTHSMALIGYRRCPDTQKLFLLLQNWWPRKQFVEVDEEYFIDSKALIVFARDRILELPDLFPRMRAQYNEADFSGQDITQHERYDYNSSCSLFEFSEGHDADDEEE